MISLITLVLFLFVLVIADSKETYLSHLSLAFISPSNKILKPDNLLLFVCLKGELRRNLNNHWYSPTRCKVEGCPENFKDCRFAHNEMEEIYHPNMYKTQICSAFATGNGCPKKTYCAFAHGPAELRSITRSLALSLSRSLAQWVV